MTIFMMLVEETVVDMIDAIYDGKGGWNDALPTEGKGGWVQTEGKGGW